MIIIPKQYTGDFHDYEELRLSNLERSSFELLHQNALKHGVEYGVVIANGIASELFTSNEKDKVYIPEDLLHTNDIVRILHSHTNETPPSIKDLKYLTHPKVEEIGVIAINGDVYMVSVGNGEKIDSQSFERDAGEIYSKVSFELMDDPHFFEWSIEMRNYMAIREQFYQISRLYGWTMKGGRL